MGGDFIVNKEGNIKWIYLGKTGDDRPSVINIEKVLKVNTFSCVDFLFCFVIYLMPALSAYE